MIQFVKSNNLIQTQGLNQLNQPELRLEVNDSGLLRHAEEYLRSIANLVQDGKLQLQDGSQIAYGYWETVPKVIEPRVLNVWELSRNGRQLVPGASLTLTYTRDQEDVCRRFQSEFDPPDPWTLAALSEGVFEGDPVEGVRYHSPEHMSGWWITTGRYDGNIESITNHHLVHLTDARPELAKYLALTFGFRFNLDGGEEVWLDHKVANDFESM